MTSTGTVTGTGAETLLQPCLPVRPLPLVVCKHTFVCVRVCIRAWMGGQPTQAQPTQRTCSKGV